MERRDGNLRKDGTEKGPGFLGVLKRPDGKVSSEISVSTSDLMGKDGKEVLFPTLVPTLTKEEVDFLLSSDLEKTEIPDSIFLKAFDHARGRIKQGKSPFIEIDEIISDKELEGIAEDNNG